jgi:hypothetical protein
MSFDLYTQIEVIKKAAPDIVALQVVLLIIYIHNCTDVNLMQHAHTHTERDHFANKLVLYWILFIV